MKYWTAPSRSRWLPAERSTALRCTTAVVSWLGATIGCMRHFAASSLLGDPPTYPSRQRYRRLGRAAVAAAGCCALVLAAVVLVNAGAVELGAGSLIAALVAGLCSRRQLSMARRSAIGAQSEQEVRRALRPLVAEGWRVRHSLTWPGRGDIDSVAISPTGIAVAIETKTRTYDEHHLARVRDQAAWLARRRRRWARTGALGILCVVRARGVERVEQDVLVVSIEGLAPVLRIASRHGSIPPP